MAAETPKHGFEDLCAELDARPPSPLRLDELPQKQAGIVRTFMKHGVDPPYYVELMGPMSLESMDEFRGKSFIDLPNWQNDLLDELLGDPEMNKPKSEKEAPEFYKTVPRGERGQGKKDVESQSAAKPSSNETGPRHKRASEEAQDSAVVVQEGHRAAGTVSQQRQKRTLNSVAATNARSPEKSAVVVNLAMTSQQDSQANPKQLGKRQRDPSPEVDDIAKTAPPPKRPQHKRISPGPSLSSQSSSAEQLASAPRHQQPFQAPGLPQGAVNVGNTSQKQAQQASILGKRRRDPDPSLEDLLGRDLAQPAKRLHQETAEAQSPARPETMPAKLDRRPMVHSVERQQHVNSQLRPQNILHPLKQLTRQTTLQRQSVGGPAYGRNSMPTHQVPSLQTQIGFQTSVPSTGSHQTSLQHPSTWDPRSGTQPSPSQVPPQTPDKTPQATERSKPSQTSSQRPAVRRNADLYQIEIDGKPYQLPPPPSWMDEEVETWKAQQSNLPQQLPPRQPNAGSRTRLKQTFPSETPPQGPRAGSVIGRDVLPPYGPSAYQSSVGQPNGSQPRPTYRAATYEGAVQQEAYLNMDRPDGRPGYVTDHKYGNNKDSDMHQMMTSQQLGPTYLSPTKPAPDFQQETPSLNGSTNLGNFQNQVDLNGSGQEAESPSSGHPQAIPPYHLADVTDSYNEQSRVAGRRSVSGTQPWSNDMDALWNLQSGAAVTPQPHIPTLPMQELYPFPRATNRVPLQMQTNVMSQPRPDQSSQIPISQPPPPFPAGIKQSSSYGGPSHPPQMAATPHPPWEVLARDKWEILEAQNTHAPVRVTDRTYGVVQLRAAAASGQKRDFASTIADTASEVIELPSPQKLRARYGSTQAAPPTSNPNRNSGPWFPSSDSQMSPYRLSQPQPRNSNRHRAPADSSASSRNVTAAPHTHPSVHTAKTTDSVNSLQSGHGSMKAPIDIDAGTMEAPIDIDAGTMEVPIDIDAGTMEAPINIDDEEVSRKPQTEPDETVPATDMVSKSAESGNTDQESADSGIGGWNDVRPWGNDDELDDYLAKEMADFPDDVEAGETSSDGQNDESAKASAAAADPVPLPIYSSFRDQRPEAEADQLAVNQAIQHTYHDLGHKVGWEVVDAAFNEKVKEATVESYGYQYNRLQAIYVDRSVGKDYLAATKKKSKKQKKAERELGYLYEVDGPWKTGFDDWKATNAPALPKKA